MGMTELELIFSEFGVLSDDAKKLRYEVFCGEQRVPYENEIDDMEDKSWHVVAYLGGEAVGVGRVFRYKDSAYKIGRVAVEKEHRGKHIGAAVMGALEEKVAQEGGDTALLSAQIQASGFYRKLGYIPFGEEYLEENIPHVMMGKELG